MMLRNGCKSENRLHATQAALAGALRSSVMGELAGSLLHDINQPLV
jgi:C4-dicarboxylate-specific signal transduction histidine kinase